jgi:hypothetical protein
MVVKPQPEGIGVLEFHHPDAARETGRAATHRACSARWRGRSSDATDRDARSRPRIHAIRLHSRHCCPGRERGHGQAERVLTANRQAPRIATARRGSIRLCCRRRGGLRARRIGTCCPTELMWRGRGRSSPTEQKRRALLTPRPAVRAKQVRRPSGNEARRGAEAGLRPCPGQRLARDSSCASIWRRSLAATHEVPLLLVVRWRSQLDARARFCSPRIGSRTLQAPVTHACSASAGKHHARKVSRTTVVRRGSVMRSPFLDAACGDWSRRA